LLEQITKMESGYRPGESLKQMRNRLGVTTREVEELSRKVAVDLSNDEFYISNAWLTQLENKSSVPSIFKLFTLSVLYRMSFAELLAMFGILLSDAARLQSSLPLDHTHLTSIETCERDKPVTFPIRFDRGFSIEKTSLISRMVEMWGEVPISFIQSLDVRHCQYGYIGRDDYSMYPLLRPGSFVQIDSQINRVNGAGWRTEFDRPIYFVELRDSYACSWAELRGSQLTLIPHPLSGSTIRQFVHPDEAEIIGQVTAVAMRLAPTPEVRACADSDVSQKLPRRL
jgi:transcriptional regulator with XRE-family HTH domain